MPCFFSEEELDEEIRVSMKSGNATQHEVDAVFCHFSKKTLVELFGTKFRTSGSEIQHNRKSKPVVWNLETTENRNQVTKSKIYFAKGCQHLCSAICALSSRQSRASTEIARMDCRI